MSTIQGLTVMCAVGRPGPGAASGERLGTDGVQERGGRGSVF